MLKAAARAVVIFSRLGPAVPNANAPMTMQKNTC